MRRSIFVSIIITSIVFFACIVLKNGFHEISNSIIISDMGRQYVGFFRDYQNLMHFNSSFFYSFFNGLGGMSLLNYYYYLGSPLNIILIGFNQSNLMLGIFLILMIKIVISSVTMNIYLNNKYKLSETMLILFSVCYGLMSYNVNYYFNIMWLDAVYMLPLVLLGVDNILNKSDSKIYIISLSLIIVINYYMGWIICIFVFIYFVWSILISEEAKIQKKIVIFILSSGYSILLASVVLIPTILNLDFVNRPIDFVTIHKIKDVFQTIPMFFTYLFPFTYNVARLDSSYNINIYCSLLVYIYIILFFINGGINKRIKISTLIVLIIFIVSLCIDKINVIWHGFTHPIGFQFRWSFCISCFLIIIAAYSYTKFRENRRIFTAALICILLTIISSLMGIFSIIGFIFSLLIVLLILFIISRKKQFNKKIFEYLLLVITLMELFLNFYHNLIITSNYKAANNQNYNKEIMRCQKNNDYYRTSLSISYFRNIQLMCDTYGASYTSSNINEDVKKFYQQIGSYTSSSSYIFQNSNTDLIKNLLSIKRQVGEKDYIVNEDTLSIGYMVSDNQKIKPTKNPFDYQNELASSMLGIPVSVLKPVDFVDKKQSEYKYKIDDKDNYYFAIYHDFTDYVYGYDIVQVLVNDQYYATIGTHGGTLGVHKLTSSTGGKINQIELKKINNSWAKSFNNYDMNQLYLYREDKKTLKKVIKELEDQQLIITKMKKNVLEGNIKVKKDNQYLFLSIPYEKGWHIYVDGKKVSYEKMYGTFIGVKLRKGYHNIKMNYYPIGFRLGFIVSIISFICFIMLVVLNKKYKLVRKIKKSIKKVYMY